MKGKKIIILLVITLFLINLSSVFTSANILQKNNKISSLKNDEKVSDYWALIVAPPDKDYREWFVTYANHFYNMLLDSRFTEDHIQTYFYEQATKQNLINGFDWLAENAKPYDTVLIYLADHGGKNVFGLYPYDSRITYTEMNVQLNKLRSKHIGLIISACHSGSAIPWISKEGREIITASRAEEVSYSFFDEVLFQSLIPEIDYELGDNNGATSLEEAFQVISQYPFYEDFGFQPVFDDKNDDEINIIFQDYSDGNIDQKPETLVINDESTNEGEYIASYSYFDTYWDRQAAQSFIPEKQILTKVKLRMNVFEGEDSNPVVNVSIRKNLLGSDLTKTQFDIPDDFIDDRTYVTFDFEDVYVTPGETYYIVCESNADYKSFIFWEGSTNTDYENGRSYISEDGGETWTIAERTEDLCFIIYGKDIGENFPPHLPRRLAGPINGKPDTEIVFHTTTDDAEGDLIYYKVSWGDGTESEWIGAFESNEIAGFNHQWPKGEYKIKVKAKDSHGQESSWSEPLTVTISKDKLKHRSHSILTRIFDMFPMIQKFIKL